MSRRSLFLASLVLVLLLGACAESAPETPPETPSEIETPLPQATETAIEDQSQTTVIPSPDPDEEPPGGPITAEDEEFFALQRAGLVQEGLIDYGIEDPAVLEAIGTAPRHEFVPEDFLGLAYANHPLPIGFGQTISQPYIVALMTEAAGVSGEDNVLEIGTGSGYQAAVLAELVDHVYTIEIIDPLAQRAEESLKRAGYDNVTVITGDGYFGLPEEAPFDAIVVTAAPDHVPQPLVDQLKIGGRLVIPVGPVGGVQTLWLITKVNDEQVKTRNLGAVRFVPLTRDREES